MRRYTVRQSFTVPAELKNEMKASAQQEGISLSAWVRRRIDELIALHDLDVFAAELERQEATIG